MLSRFFHTLLGLSLLFVCCSKAPRITQELPNILLIVLDTARTDHLSCYGYHRPTTPNIDRVAAEGLRFTRAVSSSSWTVPAHASLFTGLLPEEHGTHSRHAWLVDRIPTLAELLKARGYRTAAFSSNPVVDRAQNFHRGFNLFEALWLDTLRIKESGLSHTEFTNKLVFSFLKETKDQPFFIFINYMDVHMPYDPPEPYRSMYLKPEQEITARIDSGCRYMEPLNNGDLIPDESERLAVEAIYDGALCYLDEKVEELLAYLRKKNLYDNTILIITSDHGELFGEHNYFGHGGLLKRPLIHIPLIVRFPPLVKSPRVRKELVSITDIFHSLVSLLELKGMAATGYPTRNLFDSEIEPASCYSLLVFGQWPGIHTVRQHDIRSVWTPENLHYVFCEDEAYECYDLRLDFAESHNLCSAAVSREVVESVVSGLKESFIDFVEEPADLRIKNHLRVDPLHERAMRALGYVGGDQEQVGGVVKEHPHALAHIKTGMFLFKNNFLEEAEKEIRTALSMSSRNPIARKYLGLIFKGKGEYADAIRVLRPLVGVFRDKLREKMLELDVLLNLASVYSEIGKIEAAAGCYERAVEISPSEINILHLAGKMNHMLKKHEKAKIFYKKILDINPRHIATLVNMGMIEKIEGSPELAEQYYLKALAVDSTDASANNNYGNLLMVLGKPALAEKHYKMILKNSPDDRNIHRILAFLYLTDPARHEESLYHFRILAQLLPEEAEQLEIKYIRPLEAELAQSAEQ